MPTETDVCNIGLGKLGGAGDALNGSAFIGSIDDDNKVSQWCKLNFPRVRRRVIIELATRQAPFRQSCKFLDLGAVLSDDAVPEIGNYTYAFNLPGDCLSVINQFDEGSIATRDRRAFSSTTVNLNNQWEMIADKDGAGKIFLTEVLSNSDQTSAFIAYAVDLPNTVGWSEQMIDCVATLLASEVAPVVGRDMEASNFMLAKYKEVVVPDAVKANLTGFNNSAKQVSNYRGGRNTNITSRRSLSCRDCC